MSTEPPRCEALRADILAQAMAPGGSEGRDEQESLLRLVRAAEGLPGAGSEESCAATIVRELSLAPSCGSAAELITSAAALDGWLAPMLSASMLKNQGSCATALVAGLASAPQVSAEQLDLVASWSLRQRDPMRRSGGLVVLGALVRSVRPRDARAAERGEATLLGELRRPAPSEAERVQRLEAAGNAGCLACVAVLLREGRAASPEVRRAAVGALRFVPTPEAVRALGEGLETEPDPRVREQAAWALGWESTEEQARVYGLVRAAARDPSARVRASAVRSLGPLMKHVPLARSAMLALTDPEYGDENVRALATGLVTAMPPQETEEGL